MKFQFLYEIEVGGACVVELTGHLVIEADHSREYVDGKTPDWRVEDIVLDATETVARARDVGQPMFRDVQVALPKAHYLHARMLSDLLNRYRHSIDAAWAAELLAAQAAARQRFGFRALATNDA